MKVTDIKIKLKDEKKVKAIVEVTLDNQLIIHGIRLVQTDKAFVITMPHFKGKGDKYLDLVHPANAEFRKYLTEEVVTKYQELVNKK